MWLLEVAPRILAAEDETVSEGMAEAFGRRGIEVITGIGGIGRVEKEGERPRLYYGENGDKLDLDTEAVVLAVGWSGNVEGLNLEAAGLETERGYVKVDALRSGALGVFAAGDVTGRMMLVQSATREGNLAAEHGLLGGEHSYRHEIVPHGGFADPEYAGAGLTEGGARAGGYDCVAATVPNAELDRSVIDGYPEGLCKLVVDRPSRRILGAHLVDEQAVEVVQIVETAMRAEMPVERLADVEFAYPTFTAIAGIASRRVLRALVLVAVSPRWSIPERTHGAE